MTTNSEKPNVVKEPSMLKQKAIIAENYDKLTSVAEASYPPSAGMKRCRPMRASFELSQAREESSGRRE